MVRMRCFSAVAGTLLVLGAHSAPAQTYDVLLQGGYVIDPRNSVTGHRDIGIRAGHVAAVEPTLDPNEAERVLDVSGLFVIPGIVDIHAHFFWTPGIDGAWAGNASIRPDSFSFRTGVTTMVDAGSAGWRNFEAFRESVIDRVRTKVFAFINISGRGMESEELEQGDFGPAQVAALARTHSDVVVGVKSAHYQLPGWESVDSAVAAGRSAGIPVMVDFGWFLPERPFWELVGDRLRPGDIATHCFRLPVPWTDREGRLHDYLGLARSRGVRFDVGHGGGSFDFRNAIPAVAQGFYPDSISTDLHTGSMNAAMMDMPTLMSKFLALGMPLTEVVRASTSTPAQMIGRPEIGHLGVGAEADVAALRIDTGSYRFRDVRGGSVTGDQRITAELTLLGGEIVWDWNSRASTDYRELPADLGRREQDSLLTPPQ